MKLYYTHTRRAGAFGGCYFGMRFSAGVSEDYALDEDDFELYSLSIDACEVISAGDIFKNKDASKLGHIVDEFKVKWGLKNRDVELLLSQASDIYSLELFEEHPLEMCFYIDNDTAYYALLCALALGYRAVKMKHPTDGYVWYVDMEGRAVTPVPRDRDLSEQELALVGTMADRALACKFMLSPEVVRKKRESMNTPELKAHITKAGVDWTPEMLGMLGKYSDTEVALRLALAKSVVSLKRQSLAIPDFPGSWPMHYLQLLPSYTQDFVEFVAQSPFQVVTEFSRVFRNCYGRKMDAATFSQITGLDLMESTLWFKASPEHPMSDEVKRQLWGIALTWEFDIRRLYSQATYPGQAKPTKKAH